MNKKDIDIPDFTRRRMIFAALASAFMPESSLTKIAETTSSQLLPAVPGEIESTPAYSALSKWFSSCNERIAITENRLSYIMAETAKLQHDDAELPVIKSIVDAIFTEHKQNKGLEKIRYAANKIFEDTVQNLLQQQPDKQTIAAFLRNHIEDKNYSIIFGNRTIEEAVEYLDKGIQAGDSGMKQVYDNYRANHKLKSQEKIAEIIEEVNIKYASSTMASAHMMGGYPIPPNYPPEEWKKVIPGNRARSGEWSEKIESQEGKPFPLSR